MGGCPSGRIPPLYRPARHRAQEGAKEPVMARSASTDPIPLLDSSLDATGQAAPPAGVVAECDIAEGIRPIASPRAGAKAVVLVRLFGEPIGMLTRRLPAAGLSADDLAAAIAADLGPQLKPRFAECGLRWEGYLPAAGLQAPRTPGFLAGRERALREGPSVTVAVCTRMRPEGLRRLLDSLCTQAYPRMRALVVDNAPADDRTRQVVAAAADRHGTGIDYVVE